jgi:hypothetical protein
MANSPNTTNLLGRRDVATFFAGVAAAQFVGRAAEAALPSTSDTPDADGQLLARWREYLKLEIELNAVQDARDLTSWNARQAYPTKPDCIECSSVKFISSEDDADLELWSATTNMEMGRQLTDERKAEVAAWVQVCKEINIRFGVVELEAAFKAAWDRQWAAFAYFVATPATTLAGLAVKTSAILYFEDRARRAWRGLITDPKELEPEQQILLTLRRDLLRIAGLPDDFAMEYAEAAEQYFATAEWPEP